jgi:hypothetical protein
MASKSLAGPQGSLDRKTTMSLMAVLRHHGMMASLVLDRTINGEAYSAYVEQSLATEPKRKEFVEKM